MFESLLKCFQSNGILRILHLEGNRRDAELVRSTLATDGIVTEVKRVETERDFVAQLARADFEIILAEFSLPSFDGLAALALAKEKRPEIPFIFVSGAIGEELALESVKSGATDYVLKQRMQRLSVSVRRALREVKERAEGKQAADALQESESRYRLLFESNPLPMWVYDMKTLAFLAVNEAALRHYGYNREEFLAMTIKDIRPPEDLPELLENVARTSDVFNHADVWRHRKKDGTIIYVEITSHLMDFSGRPARLVLANDVTERKLAQETASKLAAIVESSADAIIGNTLDGTIRIWNKGAQKLYGYREAETVGRSIALMIPPDRNDELTTILNRLKRGESFDNYETERLTKDARRIYVSLTISPIRDNAGRINGFSTISRDITDRKMAEAALMESESRKDAILRTALDCVITMDHDGKIIEFNPAAERTFGYSRDETIGKPMADLIIPPRLRDAHQAGLGKYLATGEGPILGKRIEITAVRANGDEFPVELTVTVVRGLSDPVFTGFVRDITERRRAEEALHETNQKLQTFIQASPLAIVALDMERKVTLWNPAAERFFGWTETEVLGGLLPTIPKEDLQNQLRLREQFLAAEGTTGIANLETRRLRKDGSTIQVSVSFAPLRDKDGAVSGTIGIIADITERKQAEEDLKNSHQRLEQALAELQRNRDDMAVMTQQLWQASKLATMGELAASVAHELNNPLATVALRTEALVEQLAPNEKLRESAEIVMNEVDRMADLVNNLLQFSRRGHRQISTVDVAEEISNSVNFIAYYLRNRNIKVTPEFASDLPTVQADRQQLRQLFLNLLTNASDAMPGGGTLTARTKAGDVNGAKAIVIEFVDSGVGIPPANLERIWDSFFTTKPEGKGTGLGLAICRRIVQEHGGTITINSKVDHGTTVRINLPATANGPALKPEDVIVAE